MTEQIVTTVPHESLSFDYTKEPPLIRVSDVGLAAIANEGLDWGPDSDDPKGNRVWFAQNRLLSDGQYPAVMTIPQARIVVEGLRSAQKEIDATSLDMRLKLIKIEPEQAVDSEALVNMVTPLTDALEQIIESSKIN